MTTSSQPLQSICHCGAITVTLPSLPAFVTECQCTICRRYATAWAYYTSDELLVEQKGSGTKQYIWGDGDKAFHFCNTCGCVVYWWDLAPRQDGKFKVGVNTRNMSPKEIAYVERRIQFDAVDFPLKDERTKHREDAAVYE